ncbi:hypothetical protein FACS189493_6680 [Spirochaetia bacterium]|nr:hypothetical protein FACS189493_6680 [Spirochaetia bacterium]
MPYEELKALLIQVITSWQVIFIAIVAILYIVLVSYVSRLTQKRRRPSVPKVKRVKKAAKGPALVDDSEDDGLGLDE